MQLGHSNRLGQEHVIVLTLILAVLRIAKMIYSVVLEELILICCAHVSEAHWQDPSAESQRTPNGMPHYVTFEMVWMTCEDGPLKRLEPDRLGCGQPVVVQSTAAYYGILQLPIINGRSYETSAMSRAETLCGFG